MIQCCEVLRGTFGEICRIQIQIYPKIYVELKNGAVNLKNEVSVHRLGIVVQLSWRVAPPREVAISSFISGIEGKFEEETNWKVLERP